MRIAMISVHGCPIVRAGEKDTGGMNVYLLESARALAQRGIQVDVFTRRHDPRDPIQVSLAHGARLVHLAAGPVSADKTGVYPYLAEFCIELERFRKSEAVDYDLIWSHYWLSGLVGIQLRDLWQRPHVTSFHTLAEIKRRARPGETEVPQRDGSERRIVRKADRIIVWTDHERDALAKIYQAIPDNIRVIPPGVDCELFHPMDTLECRDRLGISPARRVILYVGRLERLKGVDILLKTVASLEHAENVELLVVGGAENSPERARLQRLSSELRIVERVRFVPSVEREDLVVYYNAADICVLPSYYESFGLAALEAAACGKPVVASRVGGVPVVVQDGETGYLVHWRCPGPFVEKLEVLLANEPLRRQMGFAARERAKDLSWSNAADRLAPVLHAVACQGIAEELVRSCQRSACCGAGAR